MNEKLIAAVLVAAFLGYKYGRANATAKTADSTTAAAESDFTAGGLDWLLNWDRPT